MSSVPGSGTPGSTAAGAVGGQVTPGIPDNTKPITKPDAPPNPDPVSSSIINNTETKSGSNPSDLEVMPQRVSNPTESIQTPSPTLKQDTLPQQTEEQSYQKKIQDLNYQLAQVTPHPIFGQVNTPKGSFQNVVGMVYNDNTPVNPSTSNGPGTLPPQYNEKQYQQALLSYEIKQTTLQHLNDQLAQVTPHPILGSVQKPNGRFEMNVVGMVYNDNTPYSPNDPRAIQAQTLQTQIKEIQDSLGPSPTLDSFPNPYYASAKSYQDLPAGAKLYHAYTESGGQYQEIGTGNEYTDALVKAADNGIAIKFDENSLKNSLGEDLISGAIGVRSYISSLVNQIVGFGKPTTYDNGGPVAYIYNPDTKTLTIRGTNELGIANVNAGRVGLPRGGLDGGGPETPQSKAYESAGVSFGQSVVAPGSLSRGPYDTITQATKDIASALASKDVSSGIAPKGDTYGGLASFAGEGSSNPIITPGTVVTQVKQNKLELPPSPTGGLVQLQPKQEETVTPEIIPTFQNILSTKDQGKGTQSQVEFKDLNPGLQSLVSGGLGGNETSIGGIQEFLKTHDYSKLTGQLPTEEINQNNLVPGISIEEQQSQALGAGLASLSEQQQLAKYQSNALGVGLLSLSQEQQISKAQSQGLGAALMDISNQQKEQKIITSNQLSEQQFINAKVNNAIDRLAYEGDLISSAKNAGAKTIDVFGVETDLGSVFPAKGKTATSFDVFGAESSKLVPLESIPVSNASELLPSILDKYKGKEIQLGYTPAPIASPGPGATLEYKIDPFEAAVGTPLSNVVVAAEGIGGVFINTGVSLYALAASYPERLSNLIIGKNDNKLPPQDILGNLGTLITPHEQEIQQKNQVPSVDVVRGVEGLISGKGLSGFESGRGLGYDIPYIVTDAATLLIGSGIKASSLIPQIAKNAIGQEARSAAITYMGKGSNVFVKGTAEAEQETGITLASTTKLNDLPTYKNLNMMRTPVPKDVFASDTATIVSASERPITPVNLTLENTAKEISQLSRIQNDLLKAQEARTTGTQPVEPNPFYINKVPMSSLGANNKISNNITKVNVNDLLPNGIVAPEDLASGLAPVTNTNTITSPTEPVISPTSTLSGNLPGSGVPGFNVAGAVGGESGPGLPDIFQAPRYSKVEFERRMAQKANPDLFESNFVPVSNSIIPVSLRGTEIGQRLEALDLFKRGLNAKQNPSYYQREGIPKELMGKFSNIVSNQTVGSRPEIFGQNQEVKLKIEDIEYNPADNFKPTPRTGKSPFDIQFGETPLYSNKEFTSDLLSPEEQAFAERYPLMKNTLPPEQKLFTEPRSIPETGKAPIQKETFDITEIYKGREEAKFFGTFELKTNFEEIGYIPKNESPLFFKGTEAGQRLEALDLFKTGIRAKLNPDYYERIGVPKELMGKFSKQISEQTTGNKLPEIFGQTEKNIVNENNLDAFYSPSQNIRQFFERLESNNGIGKNKTKINTDKVLGIDNEPPTIGEAKERLSVIEKAGLKRTERENKLIKVPQINPEDVLSNARTFFENEKKMFSENRISLAGVGNTKKIINTTEVKESSSPASLNVLDTKELDSLSPSEFESAWLESRRPFAKLSNEALAGAIRLYKSKLNASKDLSPEESMKQGFGLPSIIGNELSLMREERSIRSGFKTEFNGSTTGEKIIKVSKVKSANDHLKELRTTLKSLDPSRNPSEPNLNTNGSSGFKSTLVRLGVGEGKLIPKGGGLASILKNFGKPSNPSPKTEEPKPRETRTEEGLIQILKEQPEQKAPFKEYPLPLGEGKIRLPKKTRRITEGLTSVSSLSVQALEQNQGQLSSVIFKPLQSFKQAQQLLYKPAQKQGQPQAFKFMQAQEETPAVAQLYKPLQLQEQTPKLKQITKQIEINPFEVPLPQKQFQLEGNPIPVKVPNEQPPKYPGGEIFDEHKRKTPKKKKTKADLANYIGNVPEFDIVGVYKRNEITYGNSAISRLTAQDTSNTNKKYSEKYQTGKEKILFTEGGKTIKVKGSTTKPKSFQEKFKKKLKI